MCEQLQRQMGVVAIVDIGDIGIEAIANDWKPDRRHMDSDLVFLSAPGPNPKEPDAYAGFDQFDFRNSVRRPVDNPLPVPRLPGFDPVLDSPRVFSATPAMCATAVLPFDRPIGEQRW